MNQIGSSPRFVAFIFGLSVTLQLFAATPTLTTPTASTFTTTSAVLGGNITSDGGNTLTERGIVYALSSVNLAPQIGGTGVVKVADAMVATGPFTLTVTGINPTLGYSFAAYATNSTGTSYTPISNFALKADSIAVGAPLSRAPGPITPVFAIITNFTSYTGPFPFKSGNFFVSETGNYTAILNSPSLSNGLYILSGDFDPSMTNPTTPLSNFIVFSQQLTLTTINNITLQANTKYSYVEIFSGGMSSIELSVVGPGRVQFGTLPDLTATAPADTTSSTATFNGTVVNDGGAAVTERGFVYALASATPNPRLTLPGVIKITDTGAGLGAFSQAVTNLEPGSAYVFAAYATTSIGTNYSSTIGFTTTVNNAPVFQSMTFSPENPKTGDTFVVSASATDVEAVTYLYDFGDGSTPGSNPTHVYTMPGTYVITISASDGRLTTTSTLMVTVKPKGLTFRCVLKLVIGAAGAGEDSATLSGTINLPRGATFDGQVVSLDIGGNLESFTLDAKRRGINSTKTSRFQLNNPHRGETKFTVKVKAANYRAALVQNPPLGENGLPQSIPITLQLLDRTIINTLQMNYRGSASDKIQGIGQFPSSWATTDQ